MEEVVSNKVTETKNGHTFNNKALFLIFSLILGIIGGAFGSLVYYNYISKKSKDGKIFTSTVKVVESSAVVDTVKKVSPTVVSITGVTQTTGFFGNIGQSEVAGTGYIVSADGLIVTNKHVVSDSKADFTVITNTGKHYVAIVKATDPVNDIAILKIEATELPVVELGTSDGLLSGQTAVAIGNALGQYQNSVTLGVISGVGRVIEATDSVGSSTESLDNVIQTDAAINSGNSGGPLLNISGQVIGMNTAVDQQGQSIGFAIPVNLVKSALASYLSSGKIVRPMLGVRYIPINPDFAAKNKLPVNYGVYIYSSGNSPAVAPNSPAEKAGLKSGDIITQINDDKIDENHTLISLLGKYNPGDTVKVTYNRDDSTKTANIKLGENS
ncbi:MAG: trypsin-like peptidase domain-containing protein [bacterium]